MKTTDFFFAIVLFVVSLPLNAQVTNINPDPNGEPWWTGDGVLPQPEVEALVPEMILNPGSAALPLPDEVYNDQLIFFPPIFEQKGASCVQAAEIGYVFTYEINRLRNVPAGDWANENERENLYHHLYTYNFLNHGEGDVYTNYKSGFAIIKENGCPMYSDYYDIALEGSGKFKYWMTNYNKYASGIENRISDYYNIYFDYDYSSLETLKHWLSDHNSVFGPQTGGLAIISVFTGGWDINNTLPIGTPHVGEHLITQLGTEAGTGHALTIVGYDDNVKFDFNGDNNYTTDIDINGDGVVNLLDREIGAFKVANSYGSGWKNDGFIWLPYKVMPGQLQGSNKAYVCEAVNNYEPQLAVKIDVEYPQRRKLKFSVGYANNANQNAALSEKAFKSFRYQGGLNKMRGVYDGPIEFGLDYGYWFINNDVGKIFLIVDEYEYTTPYVDGTIDYFSIVDYRWNEEFELPCDQANVAILDAQETILSIDYDLIPHEAPITQDLSLFSNMVSRFSPNIDNNSTLTVEQGVRIDMYSSDINIINGSSLVIEDDVTFIAKKGRCNIVIDGSISLGTNISFIAEEGAELDIIINNQNLITSISECTFNNASIYSYADELNLNLCSFTDCDAISSYRGDASITNSFFVDSWIYVTDQDSDPNTVITISDCNISNPNVFAGISMSNCGKYFIHDNIIRASEDGIRIYNCGSSNTGNQNVYDNTIYLCGESGIEAFNMTGSIYMNHIYNNKYGIRMLNGSNIALYGNSSAQTSLETQEIRDNSSYELYISQNSFPWYIRHNVISDSDNAGNPTDPILYYNVSGSGDVSLKDIEYNCWGTNFVASQDLYPHSYFDYLPTWCPGGSGAITPTAEQMYSDGQDQFAAQQYSDSKATYTSLIDTYPKTVYAASAMKELTVLEQFAGDDYSSLQNYFATNDSIQTDTTLRKLALKLCNVCDIKQENWPSAIDYFENIISNPETLEDSVFAIIDLGYVYFLMENSGFKSAYEGRFKEYIPKNKQKFREHRDYLLTLLPGTKSKQLEMPNTASAKQAELIGNSPNPFSESTVLSYRIMQEGNVEITVMDASGQIVKKENLGVVPKGTYEYYLNTESLSMGMYFYSISVNGQTFDIKKMTKIR